MGEYEMCKICKINHKQGRQHNFFPRHKNSLSSLLSRFQNKLSHIKSSLQNPTLTLTLSLPSSDRIWCIFCDSDILDFDSTSFTSYNAINHFASDDHFKNLKHFMWKYGAAAAVHKVDSFRFTQDEFDKWQKRCKALKNEATSSSERYRVPLHGQSNDIQPNYEITNSFANNNNIHFVDSRDSKDVMPLQYDTNENCQVPHSDTTGADKIGTLPLLVSGTSSAPWASSSHGSNNGNSTYMSHSGQHSLLSNGANDGFSIAEVPTNPSFGNREHINQGYQNLTQISNVKLEDVKGNVHSGASPPWLEGFEAHDKHEQSRETRLNSTQRNSKKSSKLNPKRVGAAWAERRKLEMEMEKRGEIVARDSDADWLPNFGRVWQSGSRKESMKEFKKEKLKPTAESQAQSEMQLRPYISKRMRQESNEASSEGV